MQPKIQDVSPQCQRDIFHTFKYNEYIMIKFVAELQRFMQNVTTKARIVQYFGLSVYNYIRKYGAFSSVRFVRAICMGGGGDWFWTVLKHPIF